MATDPPERIEDAEAASLISIKSVAPTPDTLTKLIKRIRALTLKLLPVQVDLESIAEPTSRVITPNVIKAYSAAAGDFGEALPYALLRARQTFVWDANHNAADYDEHMARATACEVLARRIVHNAPPERLTSIMSTRYNYREWDGDASNLSSALEMAIDQHCTIFLSSTEAQHVVNSLWIGALVQQNNDNHDIDYVPYEKSDYVKNNAKTFWRRLDPGRIAVPKYQNAFRIVVWLFFLFVYSQAVRSPLERSQAGHPFDEFEIILYVMALAFNFEDLYRIAKTLWLFSWRALGFWTVISTTTDALILTAFILRLMGVFGNGEQADFWHYRSFQVLSCVGPLIWMKLITVVDGFKVIGTMQICVARMFQESTIFFLLLSILLAGFTQAMYALDAADGLTEHPSSAFNLLLQALLQAPEFSELKGFNLLLYYFWCIATTIVLLNVLISLFASAYDDVVQDAEAQYLAFFAGKTVSMIRAPDSFLYPAPFNLIEIFFVAPLEPFISARAYYKYNRSLMRILFFIPLVCISFYEAYLDPRQNKFTRAWLEANEEGEEEDPDCQDPQMADDEEDGMKICKVPFEELIKAFPNTGMSAEAVIVEQIASLNKKLDQLTAMLEKSGAKSEVGNGVKEEREE